MEKSKTEARDIQSAAASVSSTELGIAIFKQLRPKQWAKNLIIFAPALFGARLGDPESLVFAGACFVSFCLISSGVYVINDVMDIDADRAHPTKRYRPVASGQVKLSHAVAIGFLCNCAGLALAFFVRPSLMFVCVAYLLLNILYSKWLKHFAIIDILSIASGFLLRAVAGAVAVKVMPSTWFLLCTTLGALYLALEKRRQEVVTLTANSAAHRKSLLDYSPTLLARLENIIVPCLLTSYAFYSFLSMHGYAMMATVPPVLYGIMRYQLLSERGSDTGSPEEIFWKDRPIQIALLTWVAICALVIYGHPVVWLESVSHYVDSFKPGL